MSVDVRRFPATCRLLRQVSEALFYRGAPVPADQLDFIEREAMTTLILSGRRARLLFSLALFAVGWLAPLWIRRLPPLSRLPLPQRIVALTRFEDSPLGAPLLLGLKAVLCFIFYEQPGPLATLGRPPGCMLPAPASRHALPIVSDSASPLASSAAPPTEAA